MGSKRRIRLSAVAVTAAVLTGVVAGAAVAAPPDQPRGKNAWWFKAMKLEQAHKIATGKGVTIALIDSPVDTTVPELKGQRIEPQASACGGISKGTGDLAEHGTKMAVLLVGSGKGTRPDGGGTAGIAPGATVKAYSVFDSGADKACGPDALGLAIRAAVGDGARIVSMSLGGPEPLSAGENAAVQFALDKGAVLVASAGDGRYPSVVYPAAVPGVVAVTGVDRNAKPWSDNPKQGRDAFVIAAPGVDLPISGFDGEVWKSTATVSGTSEATAFVAGGLALAMEKWPKATGNQLIQHLIRTPAGRDGFVRDTTYGYGVMNVLNMLERDPTKWEDVNPLLPATAVAAAPGTGEASAPTADPVPAAPVATAAESEDGGGGMPVWIFAVVGIAVVGAAGGVVVARGRGAKGAA